MCREKDHDPAFSSDIIMALYLFHIMRLCPLHVSTDWRIFYTPIKTHVILCPDVGMSDHPSVCRCAELVTEPDEGHGHQVKIQMVMFPVHSMILKPLKISSGNFLQI